MADWRYIAQRVDGDAAGEFLDWELPLTDPDLGEVLSGPPPGSASIDIAYSRLIGPDRRPLLEKWGTAIYAEADGQIHGGWLVADVLADGPRLTLDLTGFTAYPAGMPYDGSYSRVQVDPLDVVRHVWGHLQGRPGGDLRLAVDDTTSPVRLGSPAVPEFAPDYLLAAEAIRDRINSGKKIAEDLTWPGCPDVVRDWNDVFVTSIAAALRDHPDAFKKPIDWIRSYISDHAKERRQAVAAKPFELAWWTTTNLGAVVDELARETPFEYREIHRWNADRTDVTHHLELGYPTLGRRRDDLRFVLGENVLAAPPISFGGTDDDENVNEVLVIGAGEGRDMIRGSASVRDGRLRRVAYVVDKSIRSRPAADARARRELAARRAPAAVDTVVVIDKPGMAPLGSWSVGDEIRLQAEEDWGNVDAWVRIIGSSIRPGSEATATLAVTRPGAA